MTPDDLPDEAQRIEVEGIVMYVDHTNPNIITRYLVDDETGEVMEEADFVHERLVDRH